MSSFPVRGGIRKGLALSLFLMRGGIRRGLVLFFFLIFLGCRGDGGAPEVEVRDAWVRPMAIPAGEEGTATGVNSAAYLTLRNQGSVGDRLLAGATPAASGVELHESVLDGEVMRMREVGTLELPPRSEVRLLPGGLHLMLLDLRGPLVAGDTIALTLTFQRSEPLELRVPVQSAGGR